MEERIEDLDKILDKIYNSMIKINVYPRTLDKQLLVEFFYNIIGSLQKYNKKSHDISYDFINILRELVDITNKVNGIDMAIYNFISSINQMLLYSRESLRDYLNVSKKILSKKLYNIFVYYTRVVKFAVTSDYFFEYSEDISKFNKLILDNLEHLRKLDNMLKYIDFRAAMYRISIYSMIIGYLEQFTKIIIDFQKRHRNVGPYTMKYLVLGIDKGFNMLSMYMIKKYFDIREFDSFIRDIEKMYKKSNNKEFLRKIYVEFLSYYTRNIELFINKKMENAIKSFYMGIKTLGNMVSELNLKDQYKLLLNYVSNNEFIKIVENVYRISPNFVVPLFFGYTISIVFGKVDGYVYCINKKWMDFIRGLRRVYISTRWDITGKDYRLSHAFENLLNMCSV